MNTEKMKFANRLVLVLDEVGFLPIGQGRQTTLASLLDVPQQQVGQWLNGESYPNTSKLVKLAQLLGIRSNWLLSGIGEKYSSSEDMLAFRQQLEQRYPEKFQCKQLNESRESSVSTKVDLSRDAIEVACAYMRLPKCQQLSFKNFLLAQTCER